MVELDRYTYAGRGVRDFDRWLDGWRERWLAGELVGVLVALDGTHAIAVIDEHPPRPSARTLAEPAVQLRLGDVE